MSDTTHQLKIYASIFSPHPAETYQIPDGVKLGVWLQDNIKGFDAESTELSFSLPFGELVTGDVSCYLVPKGGVVKAVTKVFKSAFSFIGQILGLKKPKMPNMSSGQVQGTELDMATAQQQQVKYGQPIRESFGRNKIVPDFLVPQRRYFKNKREHWMEALLCVGVGEFSYNDSDIKLSNSLLNGIGDGNYARIYDPNADLSAESAADWWYTSKEVGPTAQGNAGLKLETASAGSRFAESGNYLFSGKTISALNAQLWPQEWSVGTTLLIKIRKQYQAEMVQNRPAITKLTGDFLGMDLPVGSTVDVAGDINGTYSVLGFTPATASSEGTPSELTATQPPELDYSSNNAEFIVNCGAAAGAFYLDATYGSEQALVDDLNAKLALTNLAGICKFEAGLRIVELPNYAARQIKITNLVGADRVFGSVSSANDSAIAGSARVQAKSAELSLWGLIASGTVNLAITKASDRYAITNISVGSINVDKVDTQGVVVPWDGWLDDVAANNPTIERDPQGIATLWRGIFPATPANELATHIEYDVFFPRGLHNSSDSGEPTRTGAGSVFRYREDGSKPWTEVIHNYSEATPDQIGFTHLVALPEPMRVGECQLRRLSAESESSRVSSEMQWFGLRAKMVKQPNRYPQLTTMAVKINGGAISSQSDSEVNVVCTRKLNGVPTRSIADAVAYIARNADIDMPALNDLAQVWAARGDTFDHQFNSFATVKSAANTALSVGFADFTIRDGLLTPIREAKRPPELLYAYNHTYSAQNTTGDIVTVIDMPDPDEIDGYDVEYIDSQTWRVETIRCQLPTSAANRIEKITADGITNRTKAYQWGMRQLMERLLDNMTISTKTELDAKNSNFGDYVNFVQEVPEWSQSALVESVNGNIIASTEPLSWASGQHVVALQDSKGRLTEIKVATKVDGHRIQLESPFTVDIKPHSTVLLFGLENRFAQAAIVRKVTPSANSATITAAVYNADKYQFDDAEAPQ